MISKPDTLDLGVSDILVSALLLYLLLSLYFSTFVKLVHDWYILPDFSHGFVIPFFVAYLVWRRRGTIQSAVLSPSWVGLWWLLPGLTLLLLGVLGSELFLARISFLFVVVGAIVLLAGEQLALQLRFPLLVACLAIPIPQVLFNQITFPLQLLASNLASAILPLFHVPVLRDGNIIQLPSMALEVAEACSGIRSLMSLCTMAVLYSYFSEKTMIRRVVLILSSFPIAVFANAFRIVGTGLLVQYRSAHVALGFFHEFSGLVMFVVSLLMLVVVHTCMNARTSRV